MKKKLAGGAFIKGVAGFWRLGEATCEYDAASPFRPANTHMFCVKCGEVWGKVVFPLAQYHHITNVPCAKHGGGVFTPRFPGKFPCEFSYDVLVYDFNTMYAWLEGVVKCEYDDDCGSMSQAVGVGSRKDWS